MYTALPPRHIRLLQLQPAIISEAPLHGNLYVVNLEQYPVYDALSYSWGGAFDDVSLPDTKLYLNGKDTQITGNLGDALRRLRGWRLPRVLWIDAVCINQADPSERSHQVAIMAEIYGSAAEVIVWLGEDSDVGDGRLVSLCHELTQHEIQSRPQDFYGDFGGLRFEYNPFEAMAQGTVNKFATRRYFRRAWVVQEVSKARAKTAVCGPHMVDWADLIYYWSEGWERGGQQARFVSASELMPTFAGQEVDMLRLLFACSGLHCSDDRDRIYSLLGLTWAQLRAQVAIDYVSPYIEVCKRFNKLIVEMDPMALKMKHLGAKVDSLPRVYRLLFIAAVYATRNYKLRIVRSPGLPTWMPDWRCRVQFASWKLAYFDLRILEELEMCKMFHAKLIDGTRLRLQLQLWFVIKQSTIDEWNAWEGGPHLNGFARAWRPRDHVFGPAIGGSAARSPLHSLVLRPLTLYGEGVAFHLIGIGPPANYPAAPLRTIEIV